jgi:hypothetical protein
MYAKGDLLRGDSRAHHPALLSAPRAIYVGADRRAFSMSEKLAPVTVSDSVTASSSLSLFHLDPNAGAYISSFGPKGTGKSELNTRFFMGYPYNGLLMDFTQDVDPHHQFTRPITNQLRDLAQQLYEMEKPTLDKLYTFRQKAKDAWTNNGEFRFAKYRVVPEYLSDDWLRQSDAYIGLAYLVGYCFIFLDEINEEAPAGRTPRWTRQSLRVGRHEGLSMGMAGPRPAELEPNVLNQADLVTLHGQLHERDVDRMARQLHIPTKLLLELLDSLEIEYRDGVKVCSFLAYKKDERHIFIMPPLPPRER